ncbi:hypothetical protein CLOP_g8979 [Closterium sp. NIES-67]|nr:hypothetical protein CLOP_g8979 [Closterium sp. NIES-67]
MGIDREPAEGSLTHSVSPWVAGSIAAQTPGRQVRRSRCIGLLGGESACSRPARKKESGSTRARAASGDERDGGLSRSS